MIFIITCSSNILIKMLKVEFISLCSTTFNNICAGNNLIIVILPYFMFWQFSLVTFVVLEIIGLFSVVWKLSFLWRNLWISYFHFFFYKKQVLLLFFYTSSLCKPHSKKQSKKTMHKQVCLITAGDNLRPIGVMYIV